jgi:hypothetical protein
VWQRVILRHLDFTLEEVANLVLDVGALGGLVLGVRP